MKAGWKTVKLGEAAKIISGRNQREVESSSGPHPIIGSGGEMGRANKTLCPAETTVIGRKGSINRPFFMREPFWNVDTAFGISAERDIITPSFLHYFCLSFDFTTLNKGTTIPSLVKSDIAAIEIPLPPLAEQKRIVAILDEAFAGIDAAKAKAEECLNDAADFFNSLIDLKISTCAQDVQISPLEELCEKKRVITYGVIKLGEPTQDGVYCLRCGNLKRLYIDLKGIRKIPDSLSQEYSRTILRGGELLVNVRGTLGGVCVAPTSMSGWNVAREIAVIPLSPAAALAEYLSYHVATTSSQAWLMRKRKGAAYVGINIEDIRRLPISLPSRIEQERVSRALAEAQELTQELQRKYEKKLNIILDLKSSLLAQAFAGEL